MKSRHIKLPNPDLEMGGGGGGGGGWSSPLDKGGSPKFNELLYSQTFERQNYPSEQRRKTL